MLVFEEGIHLLDGFLMVNDSNNLILSGEESISVGADGLPEPTTTINCTPNSGLYFFRSATIHLHNIHLESCGGIFNFGKKLQCCSSIAFSARSVHESGNYQQLQGMWTDHAGTS